MTDNPNIWEFSEPKHHRAEVIFGVAAFLIAVLLSTQVTTQVVWDLNRSFVNQPAFWPVMAISGMLLFGSFELFHTLRRKKSGRGTSIVGEVLRWIRASEYVIWFMVYVYVVPVLGYLPTSLAFTGALTLRLGYRSAKMVFAALLVGFATVVFFKSLLSVKIPGGDFYEYLPLGLRNFLVLYL